MESERERERERERDVGGAREIDLLDTKEDLQQQGKLSPSST